MDSINKNQPEENHRSLAGTEAGERIMEMAEKNNICFFCTRPFTDESMGVRPMSIQKTDPDGTMWFLSAKDSYKNQEILADESVRLYIQGSAHSDFLFLKGTAMISDNPEKIHELWKPIVKAWFTEGEDDPRISVIRFTPQEGYYWDNKHGNLIAGMKILAGALMGKTLDDSIEGELSPK